MRARFCCMQCCIFKYFSSISLGENMNICHGIKNPLNYIHIRIYQIFLKIVAHLYLSPSLFITTFIRMQMLGAWGIQNINKYTKICVFWLTKLRFVCTEYKAHFSSSKHCINSSYSLKTTLFICFQCCFR